jgi:hypothetical protein|mmetsp:Transcript_22198/g.48192  ORF Transcript_22198/g.48192 Transcript_22198/m.48192 type:complete len:119 (-) Transcript_22198:1596-1952(-)|eukprot:scaffold193_cov203-Alexandrium_tamarense.AAC.28
MTKINTINGIPPLTTISPSCVKYYKSKATIDLEAIGTPSYNVLLNLLRCQVKHPNVPSAVENESKGDGANCTKVEKMYSACHAAVMGVGNYKGSRNCGEQMKQLFLCVNSEAFVSVDE